MEDYKKTIHQIITGTWQLFKAHLPVQEADSYWDDVVDGYTELSKRYTGTKYYNFAVSASMNCMDELVRLFREGGTA